MLPEKPNIMALDRDIQQARNEDKDARQHRNGLLWEDWLKVKRAKRQQLQQVRYRKREYLQKCAEEWMTSKAEEADRASERRHMGTVFQIIRELIQAKEHRRRFGHRRHDNPQEEAEAWKIHFALIQQGVEDDDFRCLRNIHGTLHKATPVAFKRHRSSPRFFDFPVSVFIRPVPPP